MSHKGGLQERDSAVLDDGAVQDVLDDDAVQEVGIPAEMDPVQYLAARGLLLMNEPTIWSFPVYIPPRFIDRSITEDRFRNRVILPYQEGCLRFFGIDMLIRGQDDDYSDPFQDRSEWRLDLAAELVGIVPIPLLESIISDIFLMPSSLSKINNGARSITNTPIQQAGLYYMFHWAGATDYRASKIISERTKRLINVFKNDFVTNCPFIQDTSTRPSSDWYASPGIVITRHDTDQTAHRDAVVGAQGDINSCVDYWILHIPLQPSGATLSVWDYIPGKKNEEKTKGSNQMFVYIPFGSYLALRLDVYHSGFYGEKGSARLHIIITKGCHPPGDTIDVEPDLNVSRNTDRIRKANGIATMKKGCNPFVRTTSEMLTIVGGGVLDGQSFNYLQT